MNNNDVAAIIERLRRHQERLSPNSLVGATIHGYCLFLESVLLDVERGRISGSNEATNGLLNSVTEMCDYLDQIGDSEDGGLQPHDGQIQ